MVYVPQRTVSVVRSLEFFSANLKILLCQFCNLEATFKNKDFIISFLFGVLLYMKMNTIINMCLGPWPVSVSFGAKMLKIE